MQQPGTVPEHPGTQYQCLAAEWRDGGVDLHELEYVESPDQLRIVMKPVSGKSKSLQCSVYGIMDPSGSTLRFQNNIHCQLEAPVIYFTLTFCL